MSWLASMPSSSGLVVDLVTCRWKKSRSWRGPTLGQASKEGSHLPGGQAALSAVTGLLVPTISCTVTAMALAVFTIVVW